MSTNLKPLGAEGPASALPPPADTVDADGGATVARSKSLGSGVGPLADLQAKGPRPAGPGPIRRSHALSAGEPLPATVDAPGAPESVTGASAGRARPEAEGVQARGSAEDIARILHGSTSAGSAACVLVVDYSPGVDVRSPEALQLFAQLDAALAGGQLARDSTVALHVPAAWLAEEPFAATVTKLRRSGVHVLVSEVEAAVYGQIGEGPLGGAAPRRRAKSILQCALVDGEQLAGDVPRLRSKLLFDSVVDVVGPQASSARVVVVGDKSSYLDEYAGQGRFRAVARLGAARSRWSADDAGRGGEPGAEQIGDLLRGLAKPGDGR